MAPACNERDSASRGIPEGFKHRPPTVERIMEWIIENSGVSLPVDSFSTVRNGRIIFESVVNWGDSTIGQRMVGLLAFQTDSSAQNWLEINCDPLTSPDGKRYWHCSWAVRIVKLRAGILYYSGISFMVRDADLSVIKESFRCPGVG
jgi:hypothetical protein